MVGNKHLKWILSLLLGPVVFFVLLIASPETPKINEIKPVALFLPLIKTGWISAYVR